MKKIIKYTLFVCLACCGISCNSFLDMPPLHEISDDNWWKDATQAKMMVDNCYTFLPDHEIVPYRDGYSDNAIWRSENMMGDGSFTAIKNKVKDEWKYADIAQLNYVLEGLEKSKENFSEDEFAHMTAEVRFIRAFL